MEGANSLVLVIVIIVLVVFSAFFSASETAFSSLNRIKLKNMAATSKKAARALKLSERYDNLLSSILIGNNIVNILSTSLATVLFVGWLGNKGVTVSTIVITVVVLIFGEISPKTLAKESPERFAIFATPILIVFIFILTPVNFLFEQWKKLIVKVFRVKSDDMISEEEVLTFVGEAREVGGINEREETMIRSAIEFDDLEAADIITPRVEIEAIDFEDSVEDMLVAFRKTGHSRLPVYRDSLDNIVGLLLEKDFHYYIQTLGKPLEEVVRPIVFATSTIRISMLLRELQKQKCHMAVIIDEYGGTMGIVTTEDILEELVGDIWDEDEDVVEQIISLGDGRFTVLANTDIDDLFSFLHVDDETEASTVGGWVLEKLGHLPQPGERFAFKNMSVTVTKTEPTKVLEIEIEVEQKKQTKRSGGE